ncbi:GlsB/YeaQ/YmgE family stress response membrane protein [Desulfoluna spongiiphila]|uniref:GlsB/YeaQ/YmgE family stress response membrane protein n=1 Tax=Desulfoluna spongiiphila TaxID=419481 RepID=UPI0011136768|nr:hypothetical protein [Desulfoluna spongiiphila]
MKQCKQIDKSGERCNNIAVSGSDYCEEHKQSTDASLPLAIGGALLGNIIAPGIGGALVGGLIGAFLGTKSNKKGASNE